MSQLVQPSAAPVTGPQFDNRRILAALIDLALLVPIVLVLVALLGGASAAVGALSAAWALFYYFALESDAGQTVGKRIMKLRVVRADRGELDMGRVAVRTLLRPIDVVAGLIAMMATGRRRQRIGDLAAGTVVTDAAGPTVSAAVEAPPAPEVEDAPAAEVEGDTGLDLHDVQPRDVPEAKTAPDIGFELPTVEDRPSVPEVTDFAPFSQPEAEQVDAEAPQPSLAGPLPAAESAPAVEPEPEAEVVEPEPEPEVVEPEPEPVAESTEPASGVDELIEAVKAADAQLEASAPEPVVEPEPVAPAPADAPKLEIISSAIDMVMADDEPEATESSDEPEGEEPSEPTTV